MKAIKIFSLFIFVSLNFYLELFPQKSDQQNITRWNELAKNVTIIRDQWGIPHVYGKTDADAVFGLMYAQCEDDFKRVEMNYIEKLGRLSEINGENSLAGDLLIRLLIDSTEAIADYNASPDWLRKLLIAFADGVNYYIYLHPKERPELLHNFKPWYPLLWTDGSIGAISTGGVSENELKDFYLGINTGYEENLKRQPQKISASNGFAFAPSITKSRHSILYINPHVTFYFRPEVHMVSEEGLDVYGAVTWGQFFVYQGFNEHCGWMHTSSSADVADMYAEKITRKDDSLFYQYDEKEYPVTEKKIELKYQKGATVLSKNIITYFTHHGPAMCLRDDRWISVKSNNRSIKSLIQSWQRTKANNFSEYKSAMALLANTSNNTVYADAEGNIAYWHGNFLPRRDTSYDWSKPVDGTIEATAWKGLHPVDESVHIYNPENGWLQNCNSTPFTAAGKYSPLKENYPRYMAPDNENFRGVNAVRLLEGKKDFTIEKVIETGYDTYLAAFESLVPALVAAFDKTKLSLAKELPNSTFRDLQQAIEILRKWDLRCDTNSVATTLAVEWGTRLIPAINKSDDEFDFEFTDPVLRTISFSKRAEAQELLEPLLYVIKDLKEKFGEWAIEWGKINRFQRLNDDIQLRYDDDAPSLPIAFASSTWGMLPSYGGAYFPGTKKRYGVHGNSFVCVVEFGKRVVAKSLLAGGESGHASSPHFTDQAKLYTKGIFKDVLFYKEDVLSHAENTYHPGEEKKSNASY